MASVRHRYRCAECGASRTVSRRDRGKAARPRCEACGSTRLEPATPGGAGDLRGVGHALGVMGRDHPQCSPGNQPGRGKGCGRLTEDLDVGRLQVAKRR